MDTDTDMMFKAVKLPQTKLLTGMLLVLFPLAACNVILLSRSLREDHTGRDFRQLYAAGYMVRTGYGSELYDRAVQREVQFKLFSGGGQLWFFRPAYEALLFAPLSLFSYSTAYFCFFGLNAGMLCLAVWLLAPNSVLGAMTVLSLVLSFLPVSMAFYQGQDSIALTAIVAVSLKALDREQPFMAGVLAGLGLFKLQLMIPIFLMLFVWKRWRFCSGFVLSGFLLCVVSLALTGFHQVRDGIRLLTDIGEQKDLPVYLMANLRGFLAGITGGISQAMLVGANLAVAGLLLALLPRPRKDRDALLLAIPAAALCSYYLFMHDLSLLLLPVVAMMTASRPTKVGLLSCFILLISPTVALLLSRLHFYLVALPLSLFLLVFALECGRNGNQTTSASIVQTS